MFYLVFFHLTYPILLLHISLCTAHNYYNNITDKLYYQAGDCPAQPHRSHQHRTELDGRQLRGDDEILHQYQARPGKGQHHAGGRPGTDGGGVEGAGQQGGGDGRLLGRSSRDGRPSDGLKAGRNVRVRLEIKKLSLMAIFCLKECKC